MSGYLEALLVLLAFNVITAYAAALPLSAGQLNLGVAGFMAIGAYTTAFLSNELGVSLWLAITSGALLAGLFGVLIGIPVLRTQGIYLALATFAMGEFIKAVFLNMDSVGAASGYPVIEYIDSYVIYGVALAVVAFMFYLSQTRFYIYLTAIKNDPTVTDLFGVNVKRLQLECFCPGGSVGRAKWWTLCAALQLPGSSAL